MRPSGSFFALFLGAVALSACQSTCEDACEVLLECEQVESARVSVEDCQTSCERQMAQYEKWRDTDKIHRLEDERDCIVDSSCAQIADGACYDEELYPFAEGDSQ